MLIRDITRIFRPVRQRLSSSVWKFFEHPGSVIIAIQLQIVIGHIQLNSSLHITIIIQNGQPPNLDWTITRVDKTSNIFIFYLCSYEGFGLQAPPDQIPHMSMYNVYTFARSYST